MTTRLALAAIGAVLGVAIVPQLAAYMAALGALFGIGVADWILPERGGGGMSWGVAVAGAVAIMAGYIVMLWPR